MLLQRPKKESEKEKVGRWSMMWLKVRNDLYLKLKSTWASSWRRFAYWGGAKINSWALGCSAAKTAMKQRPSPAVCVSESDVRERHQKSNRNVQAAGHRGHCLCSWKTIKGCLFLVGFKAECWTLHSLNKSHVLKHLRMKSIQSTSCHCGEKKQFNLKTWSQHQAKCQSHQAVIRLPSDEKLHSSLISNYTPNNRVFCGARKGEWKRERERSAITNRRDAESATQQQSSRFRCERSYIEWQRKSEGGASNQSEKG